MSITVSNVRWVTQLHATAPANFEQLASSQLAYDLEDDRIYLRRDWLDEAEPEFKKTELFTALKLLFDQHPTAEYVVLDVM
jgi:hypothetical protein